MTEGVTDIVGTAGQDGVGANTFSFGSFRQRRRHARLPPLPTLASARLRP